MPSNYVYNIRAQLTLTNYVLVWRAHVTIDASKLRVQPTRLTYVYNIGLSLARTYYTMWLARTNLLLESVPNSKLSSLFPENEYTR